MEQEINRKAVQLTRDYMQTLPKDMLRDDARMCKIKEQAYLVFKFSNTPVEVLESGMMKMQPTQLTQFYRKLAKQLHPDKNDHPQAKEAFQRFQQAMELAKKSRPVSSARFTGYWLTHSPENR